MCKMTECMASFPFFRVEHKLKGATLIRQTDDKTLPEKTFNMGLTSMDVSFFKVKW